MQIAAMTSLFYTRRDHKEKLPFVDCVRRLRAAGFRHIDLPLQSLALGENEFCRDDWRERAEELRDEAEKLGVTFLQSHAPFYTGRTYDPDDEETNRYFGKMLLRSAEIAKIAGLKYAVIHPVQDPRRPTPDKDAHLALTKSIHAQYLERAAALGITPVFENLPDRYHDGRFSMGADDLILLMDAFREYGAEVCWDFGHGHVNFHEAQCAEIAKLRGHIKCTHVHDNLGKEDQHLLPFTGTVPWELVLPALRKAEYAGDLVLEVKADGFPEDCKDDFARLCARVSQTLLRLYEAEPGC